MRVKRYIKIMTAIYRGRIKGREAADRGEAEWTRRRMLDRRVRLIWCAEDLRKELRENGYNDEMIEHLDDIAGKMV